MIEIKNLCKSFEKYQVLTDLSIKIDEGKIFGLVGINGAGKSTLLRLISGIYNKDSGSILIDGEEVFENEFCKKKIFFLPDEPFYSSHVTPYNLCDLYQAFYEFDKEEYLSYLNDYKLPIKKPMSKFSKGMKRQCALICAIATNADYMFFDETFDGLDPVIRSTMKKVLIKQMNKKNTTVVMTSHNLRELEDICDNLGLLYKGGILFESDIDTIKTNMYKVQISLKKDFDKDDFKDFDVVSFKKQGSIATIIIKDKDGNSKKKLEKMKPLILDFLNLTLEEVFIYEMEALGYEFNKFI